ncbi:hypothetical protein JTB14_015159 [Gonioctena quinquepunctata]|nr:hypothetical protein JTB14_015159 [Gonioctena quinquepunctata]
MILQVRWQEEGSANDGGHDHRFEYSKKKHLDSSTQKKKIKYKKRITSILLYMFLVNVVVLVTAAIFVFLDEESYILKQNLCKHRKRRGVDDVNSQSTLYERSSPFDIHKDEIVNLAKGKNSKTINNFRKEKNVEYSEHYPEYNDNNEYNTDDYYNNYQFDPGDEEHRDIIEANRNTHAYPRDPLYYNHPENEYAPSDVGAYYSPLNIDNMEKPPHDNEINYGANIDYGFGRHFLDNGGKKIEKSRSDGEKYTAKPSIKALSIGIHRPEEEPFQVPLSLEYPYSVNSDYEQDSSPVIATTTWVASENSPITTPVTQEITSNDIINEIIEDVKIGENGEGNDILGDIPLEFKEDMSRDENGGHISSTSPGIDESHLEIFSTDLIEISSTVSDIEGYYSRESSRGGAAKGISFSPKSVTAFDVENTPSESFVEESTLSIQSDPSVYRSNLDGDDARLKLKSESPSRTLELQSNQQTMYSPCFYPYANPYFPPNKAADGTQLMKIVPASNPKSPQYILNPPMYPYMQPAMVPPLQYSTSYWPPMIQQGQNMPNYWPPQVQPQNNNQIEVSGPGGQFYVCNPIPPVTNNIASMSGIEVRRVASNMQDLLQNATEYREAEEFPDSKMRGASIICPMGQKGCLDGSKCIPKHHICDNEAHCDDGSDEMFCTCKERVGKLRNCDGYSDCPNGEDELGCFGCSINEFSCDDWSRFRKSTCIPIEHRCDNIRQCEITGKDEEDCSALADNVGNQPQHKISNSVGFLHRNFKGKWYPTCFGTDLWATEICKAESGPSTINPRSHMMLTTNNYEGLFINILPNNDVSLVKTCVQDRAAFVECPPMYCGLRMTIKNPYRPQEVDTSAENLISDLERFVRLPDGDDVFSRGLRSPNEQTEENGTPGKDQESVLGIGRVVGGKPSQPAAWPWLVSIYKNGIFHCGGVLINELWVVTAAHCVDKYWLYYFEIQAGMMRRFSHAPMEQHRWASQIISHEFYTKSTLRNDIALMKLSSPARFNRYVRPICLPSEATAGRDFVRGPSAGTICTTVGWGATMEHGSDPDHMREVEVPILQECTRPDDNSDDELCAGLSEGGKDACQGDSGGPLMCRNPNNPSQWHLAGIVSHGEGCARPNEPGVYTKVGKYVGWLTENMGDVKFLQRIPLQSCPGFICKFTNKCLPKKHHCDRIVDCLFGDDEVNCRHTFKNIFKHSREDLHPIFERTRQHVEQEIYSGNTQVDNSAQFDSRQNNSKKIEKQADGKQSESSPFNESSATNNIQEFFKCENILQLTPMRKRCNKQVDCEDGTDEANCSCADYVRNDNPTAICDGITDCFDLSDELNCGKPSVIFHVDRLVKCKNNSEYHCRQSGQCIALSKRCDGVAHCLKNEDEWDCAALTDGKTLTLDSDLRPDLAMSGIITINRFGVWKPFCASANTSHNEASVVTDVCNLLGFEEYTGYHEYQVEERQLSVRMRNADQPKGENLLGSEKCAGLYVKCSNVSLDKAIHNVRLDNVTGDVELYTSPWNAVIYADGIYRCMGTVLNRRWIVTSVNCFPGITKLRRYYVAVLLGKGKAQLEVQGPHELTLRLVHVESIPNSDILLLQTDKNITFSRYVRSVFLNHRRDRNRKEKCVAIGLQENRAMYIRLQPVQHCFVGLRCFESKITERCENSEPWSGTIVCDSGNGWYPAAVYFEETGHCGLSSVRKYTSIPYHKNKILITMDQTPLEVDAPRCNGFRCELGECLHKNKICDGIPDCRSGEDEQADLCYEKETYCHRSGNCECPTSHLQCKNSKCVPKNTFCDRHNNCGDNSDEPDICSCRAYLELTNSSKICDGIIHCVDRSDENPKFCPCRPNTFQCISADACVANDMVCDGHNDCPNGEDELLCLNLVAKDNKSSNAGEVMSRTGGIWHPGCFNLSYTPAELGKICDKLGFSGSNANQLIPPRNIANITALRPVIDHFNVVWIHRNPRYKFKLGLRTGNEPYVTFVQDENCSRLFLACM